jgi:hypothetical protein
LAGHETDPTKQIPLQQSIVYGPKEDRNLSYSMKDINIYSVKMKALNKYNYQSINALGTLVDQDLPSSPPLISHQDFHNGHWMKHPDTSQPLQFQD